MIAHRKKMSLEKNLTKNVIFLLKIIFRIFRIFLPEVYTKNKN